MVRGLSQLLQTSVFSHVRSNLFVDIHATSEGRFALIRGYGTANYIKYSGTPIVAILKTLWLLFLCTNDRPRINFKFNKKSGNTFES